jgi:predicted glycoside hydrolase/deacetylase ChbG (UPF0249 family)
MLWPIHDKSALNDDAKGILLCADDFAQSEQISAGILALANQQRLNAISCLVNMPYWSEAHADLAQVQSSHFIGLHLNLTFGQPLSALWYKHYGSEFKGLLPLLKLAYSRRLDAAVVAAEIQAQIDMFTQDMHMYPDFIDGHQHIQQLPMIRNVLLDLYQRHYQRVYGSSREEIDSDSPQACFLRKTYNNWRDLGSMVGFPKTQALSILGGMKWGRMLTNANISRNRSFAGVYRFHAAKRYRHYFQQFLSHVSPGGLIMCHPGYPSEASQDPLYRYRHYELAYFMSSDFLQDMQDNAARLIYKHQ